jgi:CHAD domain-containing protein
MCITATNPCQETRAMSEEEATLSNSAEALPPSPRPGQRSDAATKAILLHLLDALEANEAGVLLNEDPECLHDYRIAIRRSRSALGQIKNVFPPSVKQRFAPRLAWLGKLTSEPRDFDVYLLDFDALKADLPPAFRDNIEPLRGFLERHASLVHADMARQLHSRKYRKLLADWRKFLAAPCPKRPSAANAAIPIETLANLRIWKLFRRVIKEGRSIHPETPAEHIHELRKTCKKLRYLLEFFRPLYPPEDINRPIKQLKKLQDYLGEFQDVHARIDMLKRISQAMRDDRTVSTDTILALGVLLGSLEKRQKKLRGEFSERFEPFAGNSNRARFRELFRRAEMDG